MSKDQEAVRRIVNAHAAAVSAKNPDKVIAHCTGDFVHFSMAPPLMEKGPSKAGLEEWFATWNGPIGYTVENHDIEAGGDIAFSYGLTHMTGTKTDGYEVDLWFRQTLCLRKVGNDWKIAHEHTSVPFYMDGSFAAATDLTP